VIFNSECTHHFVGRDPPRLTETAYSAHQFHIWIWWRRPARGAEKEHKKKGRIGREENEREGRGREERGRKRG